MNQRIKLTTSRRSRERYYLIRDGRGMGGYREPAGHYAHEWVVVNGTDRGNGYPGYMSVDYALTASWLPDSAKAIIRATLKLEN